MKTLLDVIFSSEKRKNVLLLLQEEPKTMEALLKSLKTTRPALLPQIKILEEHCLVDNYKDVYELTTIGKLVVNEMVPLLDTIDLFDSDIDYFGIHNLNFIPPHLLSRMSELGKATIVNVPLTNQYDIKSIYQEKSKETTFLYAVTGLLYPNYHVVFSDLIENDTKICIIVSKELLEKIRTHHHADFKNYMKSKLVNIYVYNKKMDFLFFTFGDYNFLIHSLKSNGDIGNNLLSFNINAKTLKWAEELFKYYLQDSVPVTEI